MAKKTIKLFAREVAQKLNYDPLEALVVFAQDPLTPVETKVEIAQTLMPYMYPKLSNVTVDGDINTTHSDRQDQQNSLIHRLLSDPDLADAAQRLSIAASMSALEENGADSGMIQ